MSITLHAVRTLKLMTVTEIRNFTHWYQFQAYKDLTNWHSTYIHPCL